MLKAGNDHRLIVCVAVYQAVMLMYLRTASTSEQDRALAGPDWRRIATRWIPAKSVLLLHCHSCINLLYKITIGVFE